MLNEVTGNQSVSAELGAEATGAFYLLKTTQRAEIGNRDADGTVKEFFDQDDIGVVQSTTLLQNFDDKEFIEIPGVINDKWVNGDGDWGGLNGGLLLIPAGMAPEFRATWTVGANDRETELNASNSILTLYDSLIPGFPIKFNDPSVRGIYHAQIKNQLSSSHNDFFTSTNETSLSAVFQKIIDGVSFVNLPGSNFKLVNNKASNVVDALNLIYGSNLSKQKDLMNAPNGLKNFSDVQNFIETQINRTQNIYGPVFASEDYWNNYKNTTDTNFLTDGVIQNFLAIQQITGELSTGISFTGLNDTPTGYNDGKFLQSSTTGLGWVDAPAAGVESFDSTADLPLNPSNGRLATVGCDLFIGCNGVWVKVGANAISAPVEAPDCVSNLEEFNQYVEYRDEFIANNLDSSFSAGLNDQVNIHDFVHDVCLFADSNLPEEKNIVLIDESTFKWGIFAGDQDINITATPLNNSSIGVCTFKEWRSDDSSTLLNNPSANNQLQVAIDKDTSITGFFECQLGFASTNQPECSEIELHLQSDTANINEAAVDISLNNHTVTLAQNNSNVGSVTHKNDQNILGSQSSFHFDGDGYLELEPNVNWNFDEDNASDFTIESWFRLEQYGHGNSNTSMIFGSSPVGDWDENVPAQDPFGVNAIGGPRWKRLTFRVADSTTNNLQQIRLTVSNISAPGDPELKMTINDLDIPLNEWHHVAVVFTHDPHLYTVYFNGKNIGSEASSSQQPLAIDIHKFTIGNVKTWKGHSSTTDLSPDEDDNNFFGYMQDFRISKKAVYTNDFVLPTNLLNC